MPFPHGVMLDSQQFWYFQLRCLPSLIQSMAVAMRLSRVSSRLASAIHSMYSRLQLGLKAANAAEAFLFALSALLNSAGASGAGAGAFTTLWRADIGLVYWPFSMNATA